MSAQVPSRAQRAREQRKKRRGRLWIGAGIVAALVAGGALVWADPFSANPALVAQSEQSEPIVQAVPEPQSQPQSFPEPEPLSAEFTLAFSGDILIHVPVAESAWDGSDYNFAALMEPVAPLLQGSDLAICNMEVPVGEPGAAPQGFPVFAAPYSVVQDLADSGFTGCSTSSNHSVDQGYAGVVRLLDAFDAAGLGHVGTARSEAEADLAQFYELEKDGVTLTVAHIAAAHNLNGFDMPAEAPWAVQMIDTDRLIAQASAARAAGADLVVASVHCCTAEYVFVPEDEQVRIATALADSGQVDIMVGHHAHVPQPIALLPGGPAGEGMWVAYGTGNFISNQGTHCCVEQSSTGILEFFTVVVDEGEPPVVPMAQWAAVTMDLYGGHRVRWVTAEGAEGSNTALEELQRRHQLVVDIIGDSPVTELTAAPPGRGTTTVVPRNL